MSKTTITTRTTPRWTLVSAAFLAGVGIAAPAGRYLWQMPDGVHLSPVALCDEMEWYLSDPERKAAFTAEVVTRGSTPVEAAGAGGTFSPAPAARPRTIAPDLDDRVDRLGRAAAAMAIEIERLERENARLREKAQ